ncbi:MAG TPA: TIR domain-containing protein [Pseudonocardiaceae bacterium]|nr:TIR domain-containing protein [Pseudonocardiaceae bacterium]
MDRGVFINYRGADSHSYGALLYTELTRHFGGEHVFLDAESIPAGADFVDELLGRVRSARVLLAVIGPRWLTATDPGGRRRIDDPDDWIHRELAAAFAAGVRVIPVLIEQAEMPAVADLPGDIAALSRCQYRRLRRREPVADLARIVTDLTSLDPTLAAKVGSGRSSVPRQLPPVIRDFTGRAEHLSALDALLSTDRSDERRTAVITAIDGAAGIGKTTLAVWWAHRVQHRFPDGTLYINLCGYGPGEPVTAGEALDGFLRALDVPPERMPAGVAAQVGLFRSLLAGRQVLIVLDNANHADQVRPLLPGAPGCLVVVTSRNSLTGLVVTDGASRLTLDLLTADESVRLVTGILGRTRTDAETDAVTDLVRYCARLPLALRVAAGRAAAHPHSTVAGVVAELADERALLDVLSRGGDERAAVRAVFDWSYQRLSIRQAHVFRHLGLHPGSEMSVDTTVAVAGVDPLTARRVLDELAQVHLIEPVAQDRFRFHDLLRAYALDQTTRHDSVADRDHALRSLLNWYAHILDTCDALLHSAIDRLPLTLIAPAYPTAISDRAQAWAWVTAERDNLLAVLRHTARHGMHYRTLCLADRVRFFYTLGNWGALLDTRGWAIVAARQCGDRTAEARFLIGRGEGSESLRRWDHARADLTQALKLARDLGHRHYQARALHVLGRSCIPQERFEEAVRYLWQALPLSVGQGNGRTEGMIETDLGYAYTRLGDYRRALRHAERGRFLRRRCGDLEGEVIALHYLAEAWQGLGEHSKTIALCEEAITIGRISDDLVHVLAKPLDTLATSLYHFDDIASATACWLAAAAIFENRGRPFLADQARARTATVKPGLVVDHGLADRYT